MAAASIPPPPPPPVVPTESWDNVEPEAAEGKGRKLRDRRHPHLLLHSEQSALKDWECDACGKPGKQACYHCTVCQYELHEGCLRPLERELYDTRHPHILFFTSHGAGGRAEVVPDWTCYVCKQKVTETPSLGSYRCFPCSASIHPGCVEQETRAYAERDVSRTSAFKMTLVNKLMPWKDKDRVIISAYVAKWTRARAELVTFLLSKESDGTAGSVAGAGFSKPLAHVVLDYYEHHELRIAPLGRPAPASVYFGDTEERFEVAVVVPLLNMFGLAATITGAQARRDLAALLAVPPSSVQLLSGETGHPLRPSSNVICQSNIMMRGRPWVERPRDLALSDYNMSTADCPCSCAPAVGPDAAFQGPPAVTPAREQQADQEEYDVRSSLLSAPEADDWSTLPILCSGRALPSLDGLTEDMKARLAQEWAEAGLAEHASIASFSRFSLQLMAAGAPPDLLFEAQRAAADEVRHARICFALARFYSGGRKPVEPSDFPLPPSISIPSDLASLTSSTAAEACFEETLSCLALAEQAERCTDPAVKKCLMSIARDEARHARLAWRTLQWALSKARRHGSEEAGRVSAAVARAFQKAARKEAAAEAAAEEMKGDDGSEEEKGLEAHGLLPRRVEMQLRAVAERSLVSVWAARVLEGELQDQQQEQEHGQEREGVTASSDADALLSAGFLGAGALAASILF